MRRSIGGISAAVAMTLLLGACSMQPVDSGAYAPTSSQVHSEQTQTAQKSYYVHGMELVSLMKEMAENETYQDLFSSDPSLRESLMLVEKGDYTKPKAVYQVTNCESWFLGKNESAQIDSLPQSLKKMVGEKLQGAFVAQLNAADGAYAVAASAICTASKTFLTDANGQNSVYLYIYENGCPAAVSFVVGEDHTVLASSGFILSKEFQGDPMEALEKVLEGSEAKIELVEE